LKILVADDDRFSRLVLARTLRFWGYEVEEAEDGMAAVQALSRPNGPSLGIIDWMMPQLDGPEVCRRVRAANAEPYRYLMLLTSRSRREDLVEGLNSGADEYLSKPFDPLELQARLRIGRRLLDLQQQLIETRDALHRQATRDGLTGLLNRTAIIDALQEEQARAMRRQAGLGVLVADLDHFKRINDTWGHLAGDAVLRESARRMADVLRPYDRIGRYGGEEFLIVLPDCTRAVTLDVGERIRMALASEPLKADGSTVYVTASIGASWADCSPVGDDLIRNADDSLYIAKRSGRNRVVMDTEAPTESVRVAG
jgi:diguanylate cyclase (GGDEF)-like protein